MHKSAGHDIRTSAPVRGTTADDSFARFRVKIHLFVVCLFALLATGGVSGRASAAEPNVPETVRLTGTTMGTVVWNVTVAATAMEDQQDSRETTSRHIQRTVQSTLDGINQRMSTWQPESELSGFNAQQSTDWFSVSADTQNVVAEALRVAEETQGAFDPTVAPLIELWSFGHTKNEFTLPSPESIEAARARVGFRHVQSRANPPAIRKEIAELSINLSAIAKGYAVDAVAASLTSAGHTNFLVEVGGEVITRGTKADGSPWRVGIERPVFQARMLQDVIVTNGLGLATSGDYRNFFEFEGRKYSHTIDPTTGQPVDHSLASVSVLADSCMRADALATAIMVMGPEKGYSFCQQHNVAAFLIERDGDAFSTKTTSGFPANLSANSTAPDDSASSISAASMKTLIAAFVLFLLAVVGMAVGVIVSNRRIKGSCGGLANMPGNDGKSICELCATPAEECEDFRKAIKTAAEQANKS